MELKPKRLDEVKYDNEYDALNVIEQLLDQIIRTDYRNDARVRDYVSTRVSNAREVLRRKRLLEVDTEVEHRASVLSSRAMEEGVERSVKVRTLDGQVVEIVRGVPIEEASYTVYVSRYRLKCNCDDARMLASIADARLRKALSLIGVTQIPSAVPIFPKYVICKHTLAELARAMVKGTVNVDRALENTLRIALFAVYLRVNTSYDPEIVRGVYQLLRRREWR